MADKKLSPEEQIKVWEESTVDKDHTKTYHIQDAKRDSSKNDGLDEISPISDGPEVKAGETSDLPRSQAILDIQEAGMTPEEAAAASKALADKQEKKLKKTKGGNREGAEKLVAIARFRWIFLFILSLAAVFAWAIDALYSERPYVWAAFGFLAATLVLTLGTYKFLRLPTRSGLAALCWGGTYLVGALYGPQETIYRTIPAALPWAGVLTLVMLWTMVAIWRKLGRYKVVDIIIGLIVFYALLSPAWALIDNITAGQALNLKFSVLSASPDFITSHLPWFLWPMTIAVLGILPLAALFALWDQFSALRRKGCRHGGDFFLALAFLALIPYGFLSFDRAVDERPDWASLLREVYPAASIHARGASAVVADKVPLDPRPQPPLESTSAPSATELPKPSPLQSDSIVPAPAAIPEKVKTDQETEATPGQLLEEEAAEVAPGPLNQESPSQPLAAQDAVQDLEVRLKNTETKLEEALARINELEERLMQQGANEATIDESEAGARTTEGIVEEDSEKTGNSDQQDNEGRVPSSSPVQAEPTTGENKTEGRLQAFLLV